jgi:hypothetical protein
MASNKLLRSNLTVQGGTTSARSSPGPFDRCVRPRCQAANEVFPNVRRRLMKKIGKGPNDFSTANRARDRGGARAKVIFQPRHVLAAEIERWGRSRSPATGARRSPADGGDPNAAAIERMVSRQVRCRSAILIYGEKPSNISDDDLITAQDAASDSAVMTERGGRSAGVTPVTGGDEQGAARSLVYK